ncbi:DUF5131 family protein [Caballeronia mineralivorans]|uniref:DUF5131 family protein n=1 Tax=Caballeronia mineralivorans TaxID=2010198 RepID=UPI003211EE75
METLVTRIEFQPRCPRCGECALLDSTRSQNRLGPLAGGENGYQARPMQTSRLRSLRDQCHIAAVPLLFRQWGEWSEFANEEHYTHGGAELHPHA